MTKKTDSAFRFLYNKAMADGLAAGKASAPRPMIVSNDPFCMRERKSYFVPEGVCGFAWIKIRPATSSFARWLVKNKLGRVGYYGGVEIGISAFNQSYERKMAAAGAAAAVFSTVGLSAYADGRLD